jgi:hypothetical protein
LTAYTVTAAFGGTIAGGLNAGLLGVTVLDNAKETGGASSGIYLDPSSTTENVEIVIPNYANSYVFWSYVGGIGSTLTAATNNTIYNQSGTATTPETAYAYGFYSGTVTAGSGVSVGVTFSTANDEYALSAYEIPASGGSWSVDASSPAMVDGGSDASLTTASFTPPPGAVLVAAVSNAGDSEGTLTFTVSSTPALTWTQRNIASTSSSIYADAAIWTATVPGGTVPGGTTMTNTPVFNLTPDIQWGNVDDNATATPGPMLSAGGGAGAMAGTGYVTPVFTAAANGSYINQIVAMPLGTNVATVLYVFINNGQTNTLAANNVLYSQITLPASTASSSTAVPAVVTTLGFALPAGYRLLCTLGTAVAAGYKVMVQGGDY